MRTITADQICKVIEKFDVVTKRSEARVETEYCTYTMQPNGQWVEELEEEFRTISSLTQLRKLWQGDL